MTGPEVTASGEPSPDTDRPRIYVASLSDYNAGLLHGRWIDATQQPEDIETDIARMLADSPTTKRYGDVAEEWAIHDYENFGLARLSEWDRLSDVCRLAQGIDRYGDAFSAWWSEDDRSDDDSGDVFTQFEQQYAGEYSTFEEYGEMLLDDLGFNIYEIAEVPEPMQPYIRFDMDAWLRDLRISGDLTLIEGNGHVYVFWPE